jgi:hypothetical protein
MTLKDLLKKKDKIKEDAAPQPPLGNPTLSPDVPEFTFMRTTTTTQEVILPPVFPGDPTREPTREQAPETQSPEQHKRLSRFRRHSNASQGHSGTEDKHKSDHRLSERLHLGSRSTSSISVNVPQDLPDIDNAVAKSEDDEARWEKRATLLAKGNPLSQPNSAAANVDASSAGSQGRGRSVSVSDAGGDVRL